jgi:hypothetical protein
LRIFAGDCGANNSGAEHISSQVHSTGLCHLSVTLQTQKTFSL